MFYSFISLSLFGLIFAKDFCEIDPRNGYSAFNLGFYLMVVTHESKDISSDKYWTYDNSSKTLTESKVTFWQNDFDQIKSVVTFLFDDCLDPKNISCKNVANARNLVIIITTDFQNRSLSPYKAYKAQYDHTFKAVPDSTKMPFGWPMSPAGPDINGKGIFPNISRSEEYKSAVYYSAGHELFVTTAQSGTGTGRSHKTFSRKLSRSVGVWNPWTKYDTNQYDAMFVLNDTLYAIQESTNNILEYRSDSHKFVDKTSIKKFFNCNTNKTTDPKSPIETLDSTTHSTSQSKDDEGFGFSWIWIILIIAIIIAIIFVVIYFILKNRESPKPIAGNSIAKNKSSKTYSGRLPYTTGGVKSVQSLSQRTVATANTEPKPTDTTVNTVPKPMETTVNTVPKPSPTTVNTVPKPSPTTVNTVQKPVETTVNTVPKAVPKKESTADVKKPI